MEYGRLTIIDPIKDEKDKVLCLCDCGNKKRVNIYSLKSGKTKSCGCIHKEFLVALHKSKKVKTKGNFEEYIGKAYGRLAVIEGAKEFGIKVKCKCSCGNESFPSIHALLANRIKSCGCLKKEKMKIEAKKRFTGKVPVSFMDYTGRRIGMVRVLRRIEDTRQYTTTYLCKCDCGTEFKTEISSLRRATYKICTCGYKRHPLKSVLQSMIERCENPNILSYKWYGAKGISVCEEWKKYPIKFINWAIKNGWKQHKDLPRKARLTIDRVDSSKGYCPENCHWITLSENSKKAMDDRWHNDK